MKNKEIITASRIQKFSTRVTMSKLLTNSGLRFLCISINLPYSHAWNTVVMSGLVLLVAIWNSWISYKNGYAGHLVLHLLPLLNPWPTVVMQPAYVFSVGITLIDVHLNWLKWFHFLILDGGLLVILID